MNDNLDYFENIDKAIDHFSNASKDKLFEFLSGDDEVLAQIALLKLNVINSETEADKITFWLTEHSSETREYSSFLINRLMKNENYRKFFNSELILSKFTYSISDVNPKVCRKIIEILPYYEHKSLLFKNIINMTFKLIEELQEKNKDKNYQYNTKSFHLYWHVFTLGYIISDEFFKLEKDNLLKILELLFQFKEYTLREKGAYLIKRIKPYLTDEEYKNIFDKYSNDENFYVKEIFN